MIKKVNIQLLVVAFLSLLYTTSNAAMVHTDLSPDSIVTMTIDPTFGTGSGSGLSALDIDGNGTIDFDFRYNVSPGLWLLHMVEKNSNQIIRTTYTSSNSGISNPYVLMLDSGAFVGSGVNWSNTMNAEEPLVGDNADVNFGSQGDKYIGVNFEISGNTHYGWVKVSFDDVSDPRTLTIKEFAYNDVADSPISAGQTTGAPPIPEIEVFQDTIIYSDGSTYNFDSISVGDSLRRTFVVKNLGSTDLTLDSLRIIGANTADFSVTGMPDSSVAPGDSTTFELQFKPSTTGNRSAESIFSTNDGDEHPYNIILAGIGRQGGGVNPGGGSIVVKLNNTVIPNNLGNPGQIDYDYGTVSVNSPITETFRIVNLDSVNSITLDFIDIQSSTGGVSAFSSPLTAQAPVTIPAGDSVDFPITFPQATTTNGVHQGFVNLFSFGGFPPVQYNFVIQGEAIDGADAPSLTILHNDSVINNFGNVNFGNVPVGSTVYKDFVIKNTGLSSSITIDFLDIFGFGPSTEFSTTLTAPFTIQAGDSVIMTVEYAPASVANHTADVFIFPDFNSGINPIQFTINGTGIQAVLAQSITAYGENGVNEINTPAGTLQMEADILPANATNTNVTWSVNDQSIATISLSGMLTGVANGSVIVTATTTDGSGLSDDTTIVIKNQSVGIRDIYEDILNIYPVPVKDYLHLQFKNDVEFEMIIITDMTGKDIMKLNETHGRLYVGHLSKGMYFIMGETNQNKRFTYKFIKD